MSVVIGIVGVGVSVIGTKIARSQHLGICACCKHNESVDICEQLVSVQFEFLNMANKCYKSCIIRSACLWFTDRTHSVLVLCSMCFNSALVHNYNSGM